MIIIHIILYSRLQIISCAYDWASKTQSDPDIIQPQRTPSVTSGRTSRILGRFGQSATLLDQNENVMQILTAEVQRYCAWSLIHETKQNFNVLQWWANLAYAFPLLSKFARFIHAIPATSAPAERLFSSSRNVITYLRSNLSGGSVNALITLKSNWDVVLTIEEIENRSC